MQKIQESIFLMGGLNYMHHQLTREMNDFRKKRAVAIQYNPNMSAPTIVAKGIGTVAENIIEKAQASNVEVMKNTELVEELSKIDLGNTIPPELYEVVAQILIFVSDLDKLKSYRGEK